MAVNEKQLEGKLDENEMLEEEIIQELLERFVRTLIAEQGLESGGKKE